MKCAEIEPDLVAYHFHALEEAARARVESHLCECAKCVRAFVEIKRAIELGDDARPSELARARLRRAVANELGVRKWSWWERPLAIAVAASVVLFAGMTTHALSQQPGAPPRALQR